MKADEVAAFSVYEGDLEMLLSYGLDQLFGGAAIVELNSGFSFTDIGADRTGVRFAELAVSSDENARKVQRIMGIGVKEDDFMLNFGIYLNPWLERFWSGFTLALENRPITR